MDHVSRLNAGLNRANLRLYIYRGEGGNAYPLRIEAHNSITNRFRDLLRPICFFVSAAYASCKFPNTCKVFQ